MLVAFRHHTNGREPVLFPHDLSTGRHGQPSCPRDGHLGNATGWISETLRVFLLLVPRHANGKGDLQVTLWVMVSFQPYEACRGIT